MLLSHLAVALTLSAPSTAPAAPITVATPVVHCQVPCGIYGDRMRIDAMMEDLTTVEKAMKSIVELSAEESPNYNQLVRWVTNKEEHAQRIQDQVAAYWLAQRIKAPKEDGERAGYLRKLELLHGITVAAMKCKQTTDLANVVRLRELGREFAQAYFGPEANEHMEQHHGGDHR